MPWSSALGLSAPFLWLDNRLILRAHITGSTIAEPRMTTIGATTIEAPIKVTSPSISYAFETTIWRRDRIMIEIFFYRNPSITKLFVFDLLDLIAVETEDLQTIVGSRNDV